MNKKAQGTVEEPFWKKGHCKLKFAMFHKSKAFAQSRKKSTAQGTIEYLVIIAVVVVISLVVVGLVTNMFSFSSQQVGVSSGKLNTVSGGISIIESVIDTNGDSLVRLNNNSSDAITLTKINAGGVDNNYNEKLVGLDSKLFSLNALNSSCPCVSGQKSVKCELKFVYTTASGITQTEYRTINAICVNDSTPVNPGVVVSPIVGLITDCFNTQINPIPICTLSDLNRVRDYLSEDYILMNNIDASATQSWDSGAGWKPIGTNEVWPHPIYSGTFDGNYYKISNLVINRPDEEYVGLFGYVKGNIYNLNLENISVKGSSEVGGLVGESKKVDEYQAIIANCSSEGDVNGLTFHTGGLVGVSSGSIINSFSKGTVEGGSDVGGLVGYLEVGEILSNSYSQADVLGRDFTSYSSNVGGLVGDAECVSVINSYSTGIVQVNTSRPGGILSIGGLIGSFDDCDGAVVLSSFYSDRSGQTDTGKGEKYEDNRMTWGDWLYRGIGGWDISIENGSSMYPKLGWEVGVYDYNWWMTELM